MPTLDRYAPYILAAYGIAIAAIVLLVAWTLWRSAQARKKLDALEREDKS